jgi:hypothetical protein
MADRAMGAQSSGESVLQLELEALGFTVANIEVINGEVSAGGPAILVSLACTLLGTANLFGGVAVYSGTGARGQGFIVFPGDSKPDSDVFDLDGSDVIASMQNCTNDEYALSRHDSDIVDGEVAPGAVVNLSPDTMPVSVGPDQ